MLEEGVLILAEDSSAFQVLFQNKSFETFFDTKTTDWQKVLNCKVMLSEDPASESVAVISIDNVLA